MLKTLRNFILIVALFCFISCTKNQNPLTKVQQFSEAKKLTEEYYVNKFAQKEGVYKSYYNNGHLHQLYFYANDTLKGEQKEFFENGRLKMLAYYKQGKLDSLQSSFYANGNISSENFRINGKLFGTQKIYNKIGVLEELYFMLNDTDMIFSMKLDSIDNINLDGEHFIYTIYEKEKLNTRDTLKHIYYIMAPPNYLITGEFIEEDIINNKRLSTPMKHSIINNNVAYLVLDKIVQKGNYKFGMKVVLKKENKELVDSVFRKYIIN